MTARPTAVDEDRILVDPTLHRADMRALVVVTRLLIPSVPAVTRGPRPSVQRQREQHPSPDTGVYLRQIGHHGHQRVLMLPCTHRLAAEHQHQQRQQSQLPIGLACTAPIDQTSVRCPYLMGISPPMTLSAIRSTPATSPGPCIRVAMPACHLRYPQLHLHLHHPRLCAHLPCLPSMTAPPPPALVDHPHTDCTPLPASPCSWRMHRHHR